MELAKFAIWKFMTVDGVMKYVHSGDVKRSWYLREGNHGSITYDLASEQVTIDIFGVPKTTCTFSELVSTLTRLGLYEERPKSERHQSSYPISHNT